MISRLFAFCAVNTFSLWQIGRRRRTVAGQSELRCGYSALAGQQEPNTVTIDAGIGFAVGVVVGWNRNVSGEAPLKPLKALTALQYVT